MKRTTWLTRWVGVSFHPRALGRILRHFFVGLGCLHLAGGPLAVLQVVAWGGMLVSYSQENGFRKGVEDTFSGEKPCEMCRKISAARKDAGKEPVTPGEREIRLRDLAAQMIPLDSIALEDPVVRPFSLVLPHESAGSPGRGHDAPPVPPPCA